MILPTLYSRTSKGAVQEWTIEFEGTAYRTIHGLVDGKKQITEWTECEIKNSGKANATTPEAQSEKQARAIWKKKNVRGYFEKIEDIDLELYTDPMLAHKYPDHKHKLVYPLRSQPKLDGIRCIAKKDGLWSREGNRFVSAPHIERALKKLFEENEVCLDGELYCDKYANDFNEISSLVKEQKPTASDLAASEASLQYWCYDIAIKGLPFSARHALRNDLFGQFQSQWTDRERTYIQKVRTDTVLNEAELDCLFEEYLEAGYEGQMVRVPGSMYKFAGRSMDLLKRKVFITEEFIIIDIVEGVGNRAGMAGAVWFVSERGIRFKTNVKGTHKFMRELWVNRAKNIGKPGTVRYLNRTPYKPDTNEGDVPRCGYLITIRDYE